MREQEAERVGSEVCRHCECSGRRDITVNTVERMLQQLRGHRSGCRCGLPEVQAPASVVTEHCCSTCEEGAPLCGRPFLVEVVGQRPLPKVGVTEPTVACCWMSCTQSW